MTPPEGRSEPGPAERELTPLERRMKTFAEVLGIGALPPSIAVGLLFYFGYVASRRRFAEFGLDLDILDLSTQAVLLYGSEALWFPLVALFLVTLLGLWAHVELARLVRRSRAGARGRALTWWGAAVLAAGLALLARGVLGVVDPHIAYDEFPGTTPVCLGLGALVGAYGRWLVTWRRDGGRRLAERAAVAVAVSVAVAALFWASASYAVAYGRDRAATFVGELATRPEVVLDTTEPLALGPEFAGVTESRLTPGKGGRFTHRYRKLRLLTESGGRLFLIPAAWPQGPRWPRVWRGGGTLVVPYGDSIRIRVLPYAGP
ncbi:hypothetical protein N5079_29670 [Planotetraspora sp. A-T 1434]|uniref:hypothetical protein n=1 Tax=Planotetraspora sp. A-T 1434 TaxID=2979219 RepID=UPI0021BF1302|nr:hypothetical protein [Planotetraspora sp. A-T 1434]MCT9934381.1 hypothetical protein [Planotetraspora sp. A-T 1434]